MADSIIANSNLTFDESIQEGDKLLEQKNFAPAIKCYLLAIKKKPKSAYAYYKIGNAFLEENKWQIAEEYFLQAISHSPNLADAHYCLGFTLENSGKNKEAIAAYYRALELDNSCQKYREKLEELLIQKGFDWRFYTEYYQDDIEVSAPETAYQHWLEIGAQKKLCRNEEEFYQQIGCQTSALPEDFDYQNYLYLNPDVEDKYGKNQYQAIRHFLVYREKEKREYDLNSARAHYVRGERLSKRNRIDEAIAAYCCSLELDSTSQKCRNKLEELLSRKGFDWQFYTEYYQDDIEVSAPETAYRHWLKIGAQKKLCRNEEEFYQQIGCQPSALPEDFDYQNYLCLNPDVENKYGKNRYQIIRHFLTHQHKEKRECDLRGNIDILNNYRIAGWILNSNQEHPVELDLYIDEIKIKSLVASIERNDVKPGHRCGFDVRFPSRIYAGQKVELTLRNSKTPILGTPKRVITSVGSINVLHKLGQAAKNDLVGLREHEKQWVNSQLIPKLINQFRSSSKSNEQVTLSYSLDQVFSSSQQSVEIVSTVNVIIPVYKNYQVTKLCIESVIKFRQENKTPINIVVIDDCSPEQQISVYLKDLAAQDLIQLLINEDNQGFVHSVNRGMRLHSERDIILLNSDAIVNGDWVDRLKYLAYSQQNIASVTPISNHASIFSYPFFAEETGELPNDVSLATLDEICQDVNHDIQVDVPSVHGFCCYLKQRALSEVGLFDEQKWKKGYGEEVDWSQRALLLGWKHIAAPGIFVHHIGSQSFTETKHQAIARAQKIISSHYPEYDAVVQDFITNDSLAPYRRRIDIARLKKIAPKYFLFICHDFGGGTRKYLTDLSGRLAQEGFQAICLMPDKRNWTKLCSLGEIQFHAKYNLNKKSEFNALIEDLKIINVVHIHINSTIGFNQEHILWQIPSQLEVDFDVTIHDYQFICPRVNLTTSRNKYCEEPPAEACDACIIKNDTYKDASLNNLYLELGSVTQWRNYYQEKLSKARKIIAPTHDVKERIVRYFPELKIDVKYHPELKTEFELKSFDTLNPNSFYSVALIGAISDIKGYQLLQDCAAYAMNFMLPVKFIVFGYTKDDSSLEEYSNISVVGNFKSFDDLQKKILNNPCDIAAFLSIWPETYSYTLSEALLLGLIPLGLNIGAIGERIKQTPGGVVVEPHATAKEIVTNMIKLCQFARKNKLISKVTMSQLIHSAHKTIVNDYYKLDCSSL